MPNRHTELAPIIEKELVNAVEKAAIAASSWVGQGNAHAADEAATDAMRKAFSESTFLITVVIGEGERDGSPMLHRGEQIGSERPVALLDCAVDPCDGTALVEKGLPGAIAIAALSEPGGLMGAPDFYMEKLVAPAEAMGKIALHHSPEERVETLASCLGKSASDLVIAVQDRPRHSALIQRLRACGAQVHLFKEGDITIALQVCQAERKFDAMMGIGAAPEGVITAAAIRCLGGVFLGRFAYDPDEVLSGLIGTCLETNRRRLVEAGISDPDRHYAASELASGNHLYVALCGITDGDLTKGVRRREDGGFETHSLSFQKETKEMRHNRGKHELVGFGSSAGSADLPLSRSAASMSMPMLREQPGLGH